MRGFHGKTMGALSATWGPEYRDLFGPLVPGFSHVPFNKPEGLDAAITPETAAFIFELVQGEGGVRPASREFANEAARLCAERGALLIVDEVQTGFGRTGTLFAYEQYEILPDLLCLAKSIAGGLPMGAIAFSRNVGDLAKRSHSSTFGGNPLACAAAIAAIGEIRRLDLARNARERGAQLMAGLSSIRSDKIREVRGLGLIVGIELKENAGPSIKALQDEGVLTLGAGQTVVRYLPTHVVLLGHIDTVPGEIPVRIEGDELVGRGAVDAKGPLAAFVAAATKPVPGVRITVVGAVEEESPTSKGSRYRATLTAPDWCVIGEPSGWNAVTVAYKGRLTKTDGGTHVVVTTQGREDPVRTARTSPLARAFARAIAAAGGQTTFKEKSGTSDMNILFPAWRCPMVAYGPGDSRYDHTPIERLSISEFGRSITVLKGVLSRASDRII